MSEKHEGGGIGDAVLLIVLFTVCFLYFVSAFMYVDHNEIREAEIECRPKGGARQILHTLRCKKIHLHEWEQVRNKGGQ